jgi:ribosomal peptide maturation radical SAM protein 1
MSTSEVPTTTSADFLYAGTAPKPRVALIYMPWGTVSRGAIAVALLKQVVKLRGYDCDVHHLNIPFAQQIGIDLYTRISEASAFFPEWFFSTAIFGSKGLDVLRNDWNSLSGPLGTRLKSELTTLADGREGVCEKIADEVVPRFIENCLKKIDWSQYAVVGFSVTFAQTAASLLLAREIRAHHPNVKIVFGGASVDSEMGCEILKAFDWIDYVVHGEAEQSFPELLDNIAAGNHFKLVPGVSIRKDKTVIDGHESGQPVKNLNESPPPDYSDYVGALEKAGFHKQIRISLPFEASRGCWWGAKHHCTFCGLNGSTMAFRKKTAARVYEEILSIARDYGCLTLDAVDNILAMDYFTELLPKLAQANFDLTLFFEVKANMTRRQVELLRAAGISRIQPGIESVSTRLLKLMNKGVTAIQNLQLLKWCYEFGIFPAWNLLYGFPGETAQDYQNFPRIFRAISHLCPPTGTNPVIFERFSPYFFDREKYSLTLEASPFYKLLFPEKLVDLEKLAYYFNRKGEIEPDESLDYVRPSCEFIAQWQESWKQRKWFCYYEKGPGFITIYDNRPITNHSNAAGRRTTLRGLAAEVYLFCDENRSFTAIQEMVNKSAGNGIDPEKTRAMLEQLVEAQMIFEEDGRYLSLAVSKKSQTITK